MFAYVGDTNAWVDLLGLNEINDLGKIGEENAGIIKNTKKYPLNQEKLILGYLMKCLMMKD